MYYRALLLINMLCWALTFALAENTFARHAEVSINGTVRTISDRPVNEARVELHDYANGRTVATTNTSVNGSFQFHRVPAGKYEIVAYSGLSEARQQLDASELETNINLRVSDAATETDSSGEATVSVSELKIPGKAKDAFRKAEDAFSKSRLDRALEQVQRALQIFPKYAKALTLRGLLHMEQRDFKSAQGDLESAVQADPQYGMGLIVLGSLYNARTMFDQAITVLDRGVALSPASWQGYFELSKAQLAKGQFTDALRNANKAVALAPKDWPPLHLVRAHALLGMKNYNEAVSELQLFLRCEPDGPASGEARETLQKARAFAATSGGR